MDYSLKDAFKSLKDVGDDVELKHQKQEQPKEEELKEGYIGQTVRDFLELCIEPSLLDHLVIADNDADDFTIVYEGSYDDMDEKFLDGSFDDFDCGGNAIVINAEAGDPMGDYYQTVADFIDDYNGDDIEIQEEGEVLFSGDKYDIPEELQEYAFVSFDAPEYLCVNARELNESLKEQSLQEEETLDEAEDRINLKKYGFVRAPEEDFSDDGNRFTCYYYDPNHEGDKRFRLSKLVAHGDAYISVHYNAPSGRAKYFNDLNGVSISTAVAGIPDLVKKLEDFKNNELEQFSVVKKLSNEEVEELAEEAAFLEARAGLSKWQAIERAYKNKGIEYDTVPYAERKKVEDAMRNAASYDREQLEKDVKEMIKKVIHDLSDHSRYYGNKYISAPAKTVDEAIRTNGYSIRNYPDNVQEKIKQHIKEKLEALFNFKDESLEEDFDDIDIDAMANEIVNAVENDFKESLEEAAPKTIMVKDPDDETKVIEVKVVDGYALMPNGEKKKVAECKENLDEEKLTESWVNLADDKEIEEEKEKQEKEKDEAPIEQIVDPSATIIDELQPSYVGYAVLACTDCKTPVFKKPEELEKTEVTNPDNGDLDILYNVGLECPHCGSKKGYDLLGQIATLTAGEDPIDVGEPEETEPEEEPTDMPELDLPPVEEEKPYEENLHEGLPGYGANAIKKWFLDRCEPKMANIVKDIEFEMVDDHEGVEFDPENNKLYININVPRDINNGRESELNKQIRKAIIDKANPFNESLTDFDEVSFDEHINKYLKEVYDNVTSYETTDGSIDGNTIIIEGLIKFANGKENKTSFKLTLNGTSTVSGLNESFAKEDNSYSIEGRIENNTFYTENISYKYKIEEDLVEGCTKEEEKED